MVQAALDRDLQAQEEEFRLGQAADDNLLAKLTDQFGDVEQARSAVKLIHADLVDAEIKSFEAAAKSADASRAAQIWLAENQQRRVLEEQKFRDLSIGKVTTSTQSDMVAPRSARPMTDEELIALETKRNKARSGLLESENELGYQRQGGEQASKLLKRETDKGAQAGLYVEGFGNAKTEKEAIKARELLANYEEGMRSLDAMAELTEWGSGSSVPFSPNKTRAVQMRERAANAIARAQGGPITDSDREYGYRVAPDPTGLLTPLEREKIDVAKRDLRERTNAALKQIVSGNHPELPEQRERE